MKHLGIACGLLIGYWTLPPAEAHAQERPPQREEPSPLSLPTDLPPPAVTPSPPPVPAVPGCPASTPCVRTLSVPRLTLLEEQKAVPVPKLTIRDVTVGEARGLDVEYREVKQIIGEWKLVPREVIQLVPCTTMLPETVTDPCTGKCHTEYKSCPTVRQVKITVFDQVPVQRTVVVSVPCLKPGQPVLLKKLAVDCTIEPAIASRFQLLTMPNEVQVPACPVCPLPPP